MSDMHDPYEDQLAAARYRAERDQARQELARLKDRSRDTTMSAYDLLPEEEREALRWVRGHGGLDEVRRDFQDAYNRRSELCAALGIDPDTGWSDAMAELDRRLMPEGMEWLVESWPRFEDGEPVRFLDDFERYGDENCVSVVIMYSDGSFALNLRAYSKGERVNRPAHEMVDVNADAVRVGDKVYDVDTGEGPYEVYEISDGVAYLRGNDTPCYLRPERITHRAPVLAADGRPLREGETVWDTKGNGPYIIDAIEGDGVARIKGNDLDYFGADFTHERPESWGQLEEDARSIARDIAWNLGNWSPSDFENGGDDVQARVLDLVRRAKALAGVSE
ncbi:hypothetical protein B5G20_05050 [Collinsella sp. An7]|uniref:hypothetical protein n=1 Tax=Collinsella sp. An7 TaxID=1965651 RepID=UPI000B3A62E8|nr:hypothetical protein [Collinsella sp. An7]OUN47335.1 hypothetical protein B5G20_05050 [Collinsella sp. An7]